MQSCLHHLFFEPLVTNQKKELCKQVFKVPHISILSLYFIALHFMRNHYYKECLLFESNLLTLIFFWIYLSSFPENKSIWMDFNVYTLSKSAKQCYAIVMGKIIYRTIIWYCVNSDEVNEYVTDLTEKEIPWPVLMD